MKKYMILILLICLSTILAGCGETFYGINKDIDRIGEGINKIFFKSPAE